MISFVIAFATTTVPAQWPTTVIETYRQAPTMSRYVCPEVDAGELCDLATRQEMNLEAEKPKLTETSGALKIESGDFVAKVERTDTASVFLVNGASIDLGPLIPNEEVLEKIRSILSIGKRSVRLFFMNEARVQSLLPRLDAIAFAVLRILRESSSATSANAAKSL